MIHSTENAKDDALSRVARRNSLEWSRELAIFCELGLTLFLDVGGVYFMVFDRSTFSHQIMLTRFSDWASGSQVLLSLRNQVLAVGGRDGCREGSPPLGFRWLWKLLPMFILIWCFMGTVYGETEMEDPGLWNAAEDPGLWKQCCLLCSKIGAVPRGMAFHTLLLLDSKPQFYIVSAVSLQTVTISCINTVSNDWCAFH